MNLFRNGIVRIGIVCSALLCPGLPVVGDVFIDTATFQQFYLKGVPDFDQVRTTGTVTIGGTSYSVDGLPNNGNEYCVPTSATDWTAFLANRGYPFMGPGTGRGQVDWTDGLNGLDRYNWINLAVDLMGGLMKTSPTGGTSGGPGVTGLQSALNIAYPGEFNVIHIMKDSTGCPRATDILTVGLFGCLVEAIGGWYDKTTYNGETVYYRNGGHAVAVPSVTWSSGSPGLELLMCNPDSGTGDELTQSPFTYDVHYTTPETVVMTSVNSSHVPIAGTQHTYECDQISTANNSIWILDELYVIQPFYGYTVKNNKILLLNPLAFVNKSAFPKGTSSIDSFDGSTILSASVDPRSGRIYYTTQNSANSICLVDPISKTSQVITCQVPPRQVLCTAELLPYVLYGKGSIGMLHPDTGAIDPVKDLGAVDRLVYDSSSNFVVAINFKERKASYLNHSGTIKRVDPLPTVQSPTGATIQMGAQGHLFLAQQGSQVLYEIAGSELVQHTLPAIQGATTLSIDDWSRVFVSVNNKIVVVDMEGNKIQTKFSGLAAGEQLTMSRSVNNFDPTIHNTPEWHNVLPPDGTW